MMMQNYQYRSPAAGVQLSGSPIYELIADLSMSLSAAPIGNAKCFVVVMD